MIEKLEPPEGYVFLCTHCAKDIGIELPDETNPYELADELDTMLKAVGLSDNRVPRMLRQQADRIAELENQLEKCSHHEAGGYEIGYAEGLKKAQEK